MGDLIATEFSDDSHNRQFGQILASDKKVAKTEKEIGWLPECARACAAVCALARAGGAPPSLNGILRALRSAAQTLPKQ